MTIAQARPWTRRVRSGLIMYACLIGHFPLLFLAYYEVWLSFGDAFIKFLICTVAGVYNRN